MDCINTMTLIIASLTLAATIFASLWAICDRNKQKKNEFQILVFTKLEAISFYCLDIVKNRELYNQNNGNCFLDVNYIKEAEQNIVVGFEYLRIYAKCHDLKDLEFFSTPNNNSDNEKSFAYNFFLLNKSFQDFRKEKQGKQFDSDSIEKMNKFYFAFEDYLEFATSNAIRVLYNKKNKEKVMACYYDELSKLVNKSKEDNLI